MSAKKMRRDGKRKKKGTNRERRSRD